MRNEEILQKLKELKNSLNKIDQTMVEQWVRDLVIVKTFAGLRFQEAHQIFTLQKLLLCWERYTQCRAKKFLKEKSHVRKVD